MPYEWTAKDRQGRATKLHLWPHQSLTAPGYAWFLAGTFALLCVPLLMVLGSVILWGLLPFVLLVTGGMWLALDRNRRQARILEVLRIEGDRVHLTRHDPDGRVREWCANRYWARPQLHVAGGPVPQYLTLRGNGRTVEIGAFLSQAERRRLYDDLLRYLADDPG